MNEKSTQKKNIFIYFIIAMILIALLYYVTTTDPFSHTQTKNQKKYVHNVQLLISGPNWTVSYTVDNTTNVTIADFLIECAAEKNIPVEKTYFSGHHSFFIESIGNYSNGDQNQYWQYYINNEYADYGCSSYVLNENDIVLWSFEESKWP